MFIKSKKVFVTQCLLIGVVSVFRLLEGVAGVSWTSPVQEITQPVLEDQTTG